MGQVIAFANNQVVFDNGGGSGTTITTDPVPLNDADRATAALFVEAIVSPFAGVGVTYQGQVSNDGTNWFSVPTLTDNADAVTTTPKTKTVTVNGAFIRFQLSYKSAAASFGAGNFDLHVLLDKS